MWITNGSIADVAVVWANTDNGIRGFLVEKDTPGFTTVRMKGKWSLRASVTSELILDNVIVDEKKSLLPTEKASRHRSAALPRPAMVSPGALSGQPTTATRRPLHMHCRGSSSINRSPVSSCSRKNWRKW